MQWNSSSEAHLSLKEGPLAGGQGKQEKMWEIRWSAGAGADTRTWPGSQTWMLAAFRNSRRLCPSTSLLYPQAPRYTCPAYRLYWKGLSKECPECLCSGQLRGVVLAYRVSTALVPHSVISYLCRTGQVTPKYGFHILFGGLLIELTS